MLFAYVNYSENLPLFVGDAIILLYDRRKCADVNGWNCTTSTGMQQHAMLSGSHPSIATVETV